MLLFSLPGWGGTLLVSLVPNTPFFKEFYNSTLGLVILIGVVRSENVFIAEIEKSIIHKRDFFVTPRGWDTMAIQKMTLKYSY